MAQQIKKKFIASDAIDGSKLKLMEGEALRLQTPTGEVELLKKDSNGKLVSEGDELSFKGDIEAHVESVRASLQSNIDAEESARIADVDAEQSRAEGVEGSLQSQITQEISNRIADVNAEQSRAEGVEGSLQSQLTQEISDRIADVNAEESRALGVEGSLQSQITSEVSMRQSEVIRVEGLLSTEESARIAGDLNLQNQINNVLSNIDPTALDSLTEIVSAFQSADSSLQGAISTLAGNSSGNIEAEQSRAEAVEASLQAQITQEISDRIADVNSEESRAMGVEGSLQSQLTQEISDRIADVDTEQSRAMSAETSLQSQISQEISSRISGDNSLQSGLNSEISTRAAADLTFLKLDGSRPMTSSLSMGGQSVLTSVYKSSQYVSASYGQTINFTYTAEALTSGFNVSNEEVIITSMEMMGGMPGGPGMGGMPGGPGMGGMPMQVTLAHFINGSWTISRGDLIGNLTTPNSSCSFSFQYLGYNGSVDVQVVEKVSSLTSFKVTNVANGTNSKDAVNFSQLDALQFEVNTTQNGAGLSSSGSYVIDGTRHFSNTASSLHDADKKLDTALKTEQSARIAGDLSLQNQLTQEISDRQSDVNAEESRAMGVESSLQSQIDVEKGRINAILSASDADKDSFAEIVSLINSVDTTNDTAFAGYVLSNDNRVTEVEGDLSQEISDRIADVNAEESRAMGIEGSLQSQITQEISDRIADVNAEQSRAEGVESSLQSQITQEISDRQADVNAEESRALAAEGLLDGRLDVLEALAFEKESFTLGVNPVGVTLAHSPKAKSTVMFVGRLALHEGLDYSISGNVVTFIGDFAHDSEDEIAAAQGDVVKVTYYY